MINLLSLNELIALKNSYPQLDQFGPDSHFPYLAFEIENQTQDTLGQWLTSLPCPVIGLKTNKINNNSNLMKFCDVVLNEKKLLGPIHKNILHAPKAAMVLVQLLRLQEDMPLTSALTAESLAYASLQSGPDFETWKQSAKLTALPEINTSDLEIEIDRKKLSILLNRPDTLNAIGTKMRDELCEILDMAIDAELSLIHI